MTTALLFFPPLSSSSSSSTVSHTNPKPSYPLRSLCTTPSISVFKPCRPFFFRRAAVVDSNAPSAVGFQVRTGSNGPDASTREDLLDISKLGISEEIVSALSRRGITELFPIQRAVLEPAMEGRDMIGRAITGSGKTLAFGIPILDKIIQQQNQNKKKRFATVPSALVLAPTRELARQVQREFKEAAPNLSSTCLYGGIPIINQVRMLRSGIDIAVGTPGRIIDLVERGALNLSEVRFVVLDEADQMLAIGFQEDVECILSYLPAKRQSMLFSATMPSWVNDLSRKYLKDPLVIDLVGESEQKLAGGIALYSIPSTVSGKQNLLPTLISRYGKEGKSIIFTKTRKDAEELSRSIENIVGSKALHGNMQQLQRDRTLAAFSNGRFSVLVATDVAARGLDIPNVDLVIHFEMPNTSEMFVHRSGRTGRAGKKGTAVLIFTENQRRAVKFIERDLGCKFDELPRSNGGEAFVDRKGGQYGGYDSSRMRQSASPRISRAHQTQYAPSRRTQMQEYDDFEEDYYTGKGAFLSGINHLGRSSRSRAPKHSTESGSDASDGPSGNRTNYGMPKKQSSSSGSGTDDFEQILDLFRDQY